MAFGVKTIAAALNEALQSGGRIADDTKEKLDKLLSDDYDNFQDDAERVMDVVQAKAREVVDDAFSGLRDLIDELTDRLNAVEAKTKESSAE